MSKATSRMRPEGRRRNASRAASGPLGQAAERVRAAAEQLRNQQTTAVYLAALQQRRDKLEEIAVAAQELVDTARVLRSKGHEIPAVPEANAALKTVAELRTRYARDPEQIVKQKLPQLKQPLESIEAALFQVWTELASPSDGAVALAHLLAQFPQFEDTRAEIESICDHLTKAASNLPRSSDDHDAVVEWKQALQQRIDALQDHGLDADVQQFLRGSATGVPLEQLLAKPTVIEFLRTHHLLSSFVVSFPPVRPR